MKKLFLLNIIVFGSTLVFSQAESDAILGVWETGSGKARVKIDKVGEKFFGKVV